VTILSWQSAGGESAGGESGGADVVAVHAWGSDGTADWADTGWVAALEVAGHRIWVPDLPGHGASADVLLPSDAEPAAWTARTILADLERLRVHRVAVIGYADGCVTAGHLATRDPAVVQRLLLIGCDDRAVIPHGPKIAAALADPGARVWNPVVADALRAARRDRRHHLPTLAAWAERVAWPAAPRLGALRTPVLLAVGSDDPDRRERAPRLAQLFHDARVVTAGGDRRGSLASDQLQRIAVDFLADPS
jgi:pimeloyl-ACP methyl ester carboxylesterase